MKPLPLFLALSLASVAQADDRKLLDAIRHVETGGQPNGGRDVTADGGMTIGPYCISRAYWQDSRIPGEYEQCRDRAYAERVVRAYWRRYCPNGSDEVKARVHNGGPAGHKKRATLPYWKKVQSAMKGTK